MAKKRPSGLWDDIEEADFQTEDNITDEDIGEHTKAGMMIFSINNNLARHMVRGADSLKYVERRILYSMYKIGATPGHSTKSPNVVAQTILVHHHSDAAIYDAMVGMAQDFKKNVPLVQGKCNYGTVVTPKSAAAQRYTVAELTPYAYECFFEDYSEKAVNFDGHLDGMKEPIVLPSKFPNLLVNGSSGLGYGFAPCIPPFNINDIIEVCKGVITGTLKDEDIFMYPDLPTGCDIVEDIEELKSICQTGKGKLHLRARIDIDGDTKPNKWILRIRSIPFTIPYDVIYENIVKIGKSKKLPIEDIQEHSTPYVKSNGQVTSDLNLCVIISKSLDPVAARSFLFKNAGLEKVLPVRFSVVKDFKDIVSTNLKGLIEMWLNERRLYKRALFNHRINFLKSEINALSIKIELFDEANYEKMIGIVRNTNSSELSKSLMKEYGVTSHQAKVIINANTGTFSKDAYDKYVKIRDTYQKELDKLLGIVTSAKKIDKIILDELEDLRKYATPRRSPIVVINNERTISDSNHYIVTTEKGHIKKLPETPDKKHQKSWFGSFEQGDSPKFIFKANNFDTIMMVDSTGKYSIMPVYDIPNSLYNDFGDDIYKVAKLEGTVVYQMKLHTNRVSSTHNKKKVKLDINPKQLNLMTLSADGYMKGTPLTEYIENSQGEIIDKIRGSKAVRLREDDSLVKACLWHPEKFSETQLIIYTKRGEYVMLDSAFVPEMGKVTQGNQMLSPGTNDECAGFEVVFPEDEYLVVVTSKGLVRKEELKYFTASKKRKEKHYLCNVEDNEDIIFVCTSNKDSDNKLRVKMKSGIIDIPMSDIPIVARRAKGSKMIPVASGDKIICCECTLG